MSCRPLFREQLFQARDLAQSLVTRGAGHGAHLRIADEPIPVMGDDDAHVARSATGISDSIGTPVSREIATASGSDGIALPSLIFVIIERSQPTRAASAASVIWPFERASAKDFMWRNVNVMNVNVKHFCECHSMVRCWGSTQ